MHRFTYIYDTHHSKGIFGASRRKATAIFLSIALLIAGATFPAATSHQASSTSSANNSATSSEPDETALPNLRGEDAVEYLKKEGLYSSLEEAISAARYKVYEDDQSNVDYYADNPALRMRMRFDDRAMRLVVKQPLASSNEKSESGRGTGAKELADNKPRYRKSEAQLRFVGAGYGNRILQTTGSPEMTADANRFTYHHQLQNNPSPIEEWYINRAEGIEHGFTLNSPPMEREGDERLRVEMELGSGFTPKANADGKGLILRDRDGLKVSYDKLKVTDATGKELDSAMKARGRRVSIEVADLDAVYPVTIDPVFAPVTKLTASYGAAGDLFGISVSISGDTLVVGSREDDSGRGSAFVFERNEGGADNWGEVKKLTASDGEENDNFGQSVSISGDTLVVGALFDDSRGSAYVFERNEGGADLWGEVKKLTASDAADGDRFCFSVSVSSDTIVAGAFGDDTFRGSAYVFERNEGGADNWGEVKKLTASEREEFDVFGFSVSISGDTILVGAQEDDSDRGSAYVYERNPGGADNWGEVTKLTASDGAEDDLFGNSVSISGDTLVVGALEDDSDKGSSYIFTINCPPVISTNPVSLDQNSSILGAQIATVYDDITSASNLIVSVESAPSGITLTNMVNTDGAITADVTADCSAPLGANTVTLCVIDGGGLITMADLTINVSPEMTPPVITCPADIMATATTPGSSTVIVNYPAPTATDNCGAPTVVCTPPSGSAFSLGVTTVTCTATDAAGNTASCSFTVTTFDVCVQDDSSSSRVLLWNSQTGDYLICFNGTSVSGRGRVTKQGNIFKLTHYASGRRLIAQVDKGVNRGSASLQMPVGVVVCSITDRDIRNNTCACSPWNQGATVR